MVSNIVYVLDLIRKINAKNCSTFYDKAVFKVVFSTLDT